MASSNSCPGNGGGPVFWSAVTEQVVDEDGKTKYSTSGRIEVLIQELQKGPLVAHGRLGPQFYQSEPFQLERPVEGQPVFGWKPGTRSQKAERVERAVYALVIGARQVEGKELVYFRLSADRTTDKDTFIRQHVPTDPRVFVCSNQTFYESLVDLYPPVAPEKLHPNFVSAGSLQCSPKELTYVMKLVAMMPLESILGAQMEACKALGQEIFDHFKQINGNDSREGERAVVRICDALKTCAKDGRLRKQYVERAWDGIGDETWRWCQ